MESILTAFLRTLLDHKGVIILDPTSQPSKEQAILYSDS